MDGALRHFGCYNGILLCLVPTRTNPASTIKKNFWQKSEANKILQTIPKHKQQTVLDWNPNPWTPGNSKTGPFLSAFASSSKYVHIHKSFRLFSSHKQKRTNPDLNLIISFCVMRILTVISLFTNNSKVPFAGQKFFSSFCTYTSTKIRQICLRVFFHPFIVNHLLPFLWRGCWSILNL